MSAATEDRGIFRRDLSGLGGEAGALSSSVGKMEVFLSKPYAPRLALSNASRRSESVRSVGIAAAAFDTASARRSPGVVRASCKTAARNGVWYLLALCSTTRLRLSAVDAATASCCSFDSTRGAPAFMFDPILAS